MSVARENVPASCEHVVIAFGGENLRDVLKRGHNVRAMTSRVDVAWGISRKIKCVEYTRSFGALGVLVCRFTDKRLLADDVGEERELFDARQKARGH